MRFNWKKLAHVAAAGATMVALSAAGGVGGGPAMAREAQAITGTFVSSVVVTNPTPRTASVNMNFVKSDGTAALATPLTFTVAPNSSTSQYIPNVAGLADGRYAVVIDSNEDVSAIASLLSTSPLSATSYVGVKQSEVANTVFVPGAYKGYYGDTTSLVIQNAGTATATVSIRYNNASGTVLTESVSVPANASVTHDLGTTTLPDGFLGAAVLSSPDQPIAAIGLKSGTGGKLSTALAVRDGASTVYVPVLYNRYAAGDVSSLLVQNVDSTATNIQVDYYNLFTGALAGSQSANGLGAGSQVQFLQFDPAGGTNAPVPAGVPYSAIVRSTDGKKIVAVANVLNSNVGYADSYNGVSAAGTTSTVTCSEVHNNYHGSNSSTAFQNVGSAPTTISLAYKNAAGQTVATYNFPGQVPANGGVFRYNPTDMPVGQSLSVTATASGGVPIVGIASKAASGSGDVATIYNCSNV